MHFTEKQNNVQAYVNLTECLTGTFWFTDRDAGTKPFNRCQAKFLTSLHARMHRVVFCIPTNTPMINRA